MALKIIEGFDQFDDITELRRDEYLNASSFVTINSGGRSGSGKSLEVFATNGFGYIQGWGETTATFVCGFAYRIPDSTPGAGDIIRFYYDSTEQITLRSGSGGSNLYLDRGSTNIGSSTGLSLSQNIWYYIEIKVFLNNSTGTYDVWVDGINEITGTSTDTLAGSTAKINRVLFCGTNTPHNEFDDFYLLDDSGSDNTDRLGDCTVETIKPDADGTTNNFTIAGGGTNNYESVDDMAPPDDDTTYNHSSTASHKDLYGFAALTGNIDTVFGLEVSLLARKEDTGYRAIRTIARSNVTETESGDKGLGIEYQYKRYLYENDPNGGGDWTESSINSAQFGIKLQT